MPRGSNIKRKREYKELKQEFKQQGRYKGREEEVAARIVNKQRHQFGETKTGEQRHQAPGRSLPIEDYDHLTVYQILQQIKSLPSGNIETIKSYEKTHKNRKTLLEQLKATT